MEDMIVLCSDNSQIEHISFYSLTPNKAKNINSNNFYLLLSIRTFTLLQNITNVSIYYGTGLS